MVSRGNSENNRGFSEALNPRLENSTIWLTVQLLRPVKNLMFIRDIIEKSLIWKIYFSLIESGPVAVKMLLIWSCIGMCCCGLLA